MNKIIRDSRKIIIFFLGIVLVIFIIMHFYNQNSIRRKFLIKGIYEIENTFTYVMVDNSLFAYYMICEPPSESSELVQVVLQYIHKNSIVEELQGRMAERYVDSIDLSFVRPSKAFPIGWNDGETTGFLGTDRLIDYVLINIHIPINAQSQKEYIINIVDDGYHNIITP